MGTSSAAGGDSINDLPGADVPFGMVQWSPDTPSRNEGGGYDYGDTSVTGFSLTHLSGVDLAGNMRATRISVDGQLTGAAVTPDGKTLLVVNREDRSVIPIDLASQRQGAPIPIYGRTPMTIVTRSQRD